MGVILLRLIDALQNPLVCFIQGLGQFVEKLTEIWWETMLQCFQLAEYPSEPVQRRKKQLLAENNLTPSHPIGPFYQRLDHQVFIVRSPSSHRRTRGRIDDVSNVVSNVRFLSTFIV